VTRGSTFLRIFSSRCGSTWFLIAATLSLFLFLALSWLSVLTLGLFAACIAARLNDIGASRWHIAWFVILAIVTKSVAMAPADLALPLHEQQVVLGFVELIDLGLLLGLAMIPGQREANRFGPPPLRLREAFGVRNAARTYRRSAAKHLPEMKALSAQLTASAARLRSLRESRGIPGQPAWRRDELLAAIKAEETNFTAIQERFQQATNALKPDQAALKEALDHTSEILRYRGRPV